MDKPIIILGMHRSGTSLVAEVTNSWGAYGGRLDEFIPADEANQRGYWEYMPLVRFNEALLAGEDANWFVPPDSDENLHKAAWDPRFRKAASNMMAGMENTGNTWYWKDPRLAILLPFWQQLWHDAVYIICLRHPLDIAMSIKKRNNFPVSASLLIWQYYILSILKHTNGHPNVFFVSYEDLMDEPEPQCRHLCSFLDRMYSIQTSPACRLEKMQAIVAPSQTHHRSSESFSASSIATPEQIDLYAFLDKKIKQPEERYMTGDFPLYRGWREYLLTVNALIRVR